MTRRKKIFAWLAATLLVTLIAGYFVANIVLERASRRALATAVSLSKQHGLEIESPDFDSVSLNGPQSAVWTEVRAKIKLPEGSDSASDRWWDLHVDWMDISHSFSDYSIVKSNRVSITSNEPKNSALGDLKPSERTIQLNGILCYCELSLFDPADSLRKLLPELVNLLSGSEFQFQLYLGGSLSFSLRDKPIELGIEVQKSEQASVLRLVDEDVAKLSEMFQDEFSPAEVTLIADYPLRAARLLEIKDAAESDSRQAHAQDESVPEDAYRHVLWSYLLTKTYGADFAKRVGDAHESGNTGNSPAEREMDYHNNAIGREYADQDTPRKLLLQRMLEDANVKREP